MGNSTIYKKIALPLLALFLFAVNGMAQPSFSQAFTPGTIGPGSTAALVFTIDNTGNPTPLENLAFTSTLPSMLPAGIITIADAPATSTNCSAGQAMMTAPASGTTITFSNGRVGAGSSCTVTVNVTSSNVGTNTNPSVTLTSDFMGDPPTSGTADLIVVTDRPGFTKTFSPSSIDLGKTATLTFTIDNMANAAAVTFLAFTDNLPDGLEIASPANFSSTCMAPSGETVSATPGSTQFFYQAVGFVFPGFEVILGGGSCTVTIDVLSTGTGQLENVTSELTVQSNPLITAGKASATLEVTRSDIHIIKNFTNDPVAPGGTVDLEFNITNYDRDFEATDVTFTDDLDAVLTGLAPAGALPTDPCGTGSMLTFVGGVLTLTGGTVPSNGGTCTFTVTCDVPAGTASGTYPNVTNMVSGTVDGSTVTGNTAEADLVVSPHPVITKTFLTDPATPGGTTVLEFTITNTSLTHELTDISFTDMFDQIFQTASVLPANDDCGMGSIFTFSPLFNPPGDATIPARLTLTGGSIPIGSSCTFSITLDVLVGAPPGNYNNTTSEVTGMVNGEAVTGSPATDDVEILTAPSIRKEFSLVQVAPGDQVDLTFTLSLDALSTTDATDLAFSDDLDAFLTGTVVATPNNLVTDCSGTVTAAAGSSFISLMGGTLTPGGSCTITVTVDIPAGATLGTHTNNTSTVTATSSGQTVTGGAAAVDLVVTNVFFTKELIYAPDPALPGETVILRFTLDNTMGAEDATLLLFQDNLAFLPGSTATLPPATNTCGGTMGGTTFLSFNGLGTATPITPGNSCTIDIELLIPPGAASDTYINSTSNPFVQIGSSFVSLPPATDNLIVETNLLDITKEFTDDPVLAGGTVDMEFTITNLDPARQIDNITFIDDLDATLSGLVTSVLPAMPCGGASSLTGGSTLTLSGGTLAGGASCTFTVTLQLPATVAGNTFTNTTGEVTGELMGVPVEGGTATDDLQVRTLNLSKSFDGPAVAAGEAMLTFTLENLDAVNAIQDIDFMDDLGAMLPGTTVNTPIVADVSACGEGAFVAADGMGMFSFQNGNLEPGASCSFSIKILIPCDASTGTYTNTTSEVSADGVQGEIPAPAATADLMVTSLPAATFTRPPDVTISCEDDTSPANTGDVTDEMHDCCTGLDATFTDVPSLTGCNGTGTIRRTWSLVDCSGLASPNQVQTITVVDNTIPGITCPPDVTVACDDPILGATGCVQPDNGTGTIDLPPLCGYATQPFDPFLIIDGLPPGTEILIETEMVSMSLISSAPGGGLGGEVHIFDAVLEMNMTGTGSLAGFSRMIMVPVSGEMHSGPRTPGDPVQDFDTEMFQLQGAIFGDPDFDQLQITAGLGFGLPSPGHTTLTQLPSGDFNVDSFFDISYQIDFVGAPGSVLDGLSGSTQATAPIQARQELIEPTATDNCDPDPMISMSDVSTQTMDGSCTDAAYVITRTWKATDACNNMSTTCDQTITVEDNAGPSITCPVNPVVIEWPTGFNINPVPPNTPQDPSIPTSTFGESSGVDNCGTVAFSFQDVLVGPTPANCPNLWIVQRTFTNMDPCGNTSSPCVQTFTFSDTTPPGITCPPDPAPIEWPAGFNFSPVGPDTPQDPSIDPSVTGNPTATDNCGTPSVTYQDVLTGPFPNDCATGLWIVTRTWKATDACGLMMTCVQTIPFKDTEAPTFTAPGNTTLEWPDNFNLNPVPPGVPQDPRIDPSCLSVEDQFGPPVPDWFLDLPAGQDVIQSTGEVSINLGGVLDCTLPGQQELMLSGPVLVNRGAAQDLALPTAPCPAVLNGQNDVIPTEIIQMELTGGGFTLRVGAGAGVGPGAPLPPSTGHIVGQVPGDNTKACSYFDVFFELEMPFPPFFLYNQQPLVILDEIDRVPPQAEYVHLFPPGFCVGLFDNPIPGMGNLFASLVEAVHKTVPIPVTDNCDPLPKMAFQDVLTGPFLNDCPTGLWVVERTWTAHDGCGNQSAPQMQLIHFTDTTPPTITCPPGKTISCEESIDPINTGTPTAVDNCDPNPMFDSSDAGGPGAGCTSFSYTITRTWHATDICGNMSTTCDQTITVVDNTIPTVVCPPPITIECDRSPGPINTGYPTTMDNCDPNPVPSFDDDSNQTNTGLCTDQNYMIVRTWKATDVCGNMSTTCDQVITVVDTKAPEITCPTDVTVECDASTDPADTGEATALDNCDDSPTISSTDVSTQTSDGSCNDHSYTITRTWKAEDNCGNMIPCDQIITVVDETNPVVSCPADVTVECDASTDPMDTGEATATDNCDGNPAISSTDVSTQTMDGSCTDYSYTITRTWKAEDVCGNMHTCDQVITVGDLTNPVVTCPADVTVECDASTDPMDTGEATATDNCDGAPAISSTDVSTQTMDGSCTDYSYSITRTWKAEDICGNMHTCDQIITVDDTTPPTVVCQDISVALTATGDLTITPSQVFDATNSTDNCSGVTPVSVSPNLFTCLDEGENTVTLTGEDVCGNTNTCTAKVTIEEFITYTFEVTHETCEGEANGTIDIDGMAGGGQLGYSIDGGTNFQFTGFFGPLTPGTYNVVLKVFNIAAICEVTFTVVVDPATGVIPIWFKDIDDDGYSDGTTEENCTQPTGYKLEGDLVGPETDCDDNDPLERPGQEWYPDTDDDGYGESPLTLVVQCERPTGHKVAAELTAIDTDCDDDDDDVNPGETEVCNGIDDNCDGNVDEGLSGETFTGNVTFATQADLDEWPACYAIIDGTVTIQGAGITNLSSLANIVEVTGSLTIQFTGLTSMSGLDNLAEVGGTLFIYFNSSLTSLNGLQTLGTVGGSFLMYYNFVLTDCCAVKDLVDPVNGGVSGSVTIFFNASGCNSVTDINNSCPSPFTEPVDQALVNPGNCAGCDLPTESSVVEVYPNPVSSVLNILFSGIVEEGTVELMDIMGRKVAVYEITESSKVHQFDMNGIIDGLYLLDIKIEGQQSVVKRIVIEQ